LQSLSKDCVYAYGARKGGEEEVGS